MAEADRETTVEQNKKLIVRWFEEVWNRQRREVIHELLGKDCVIHDGLVSIRGPVEFDKFYDILNRQFSGIVFKPLVMIGEGDLACMHWSALFVHTATGTRANITGTSIVQVKDGKFVEAWQNWDTGGLKAQVPSTVFE